MTRFLLTTLILLSLASLAAAGHREVLRSRMKVKETTVTAQNVREARLFGIVVRPVRVAVRVATAPLRVVGRVSAGCLGDFGSTWRMSGGGCIGTVTAVRVPVRTGAGCTGLIGPSLPPPVVPRVIPMPIPHKK